MKTAHSTAVLLITAIAFSACVKDIKPDLNYGIDPHTQQSLLCKSLRLAGINLDGAMPMSSGFGSPLVISYADAVEISAGVLLYIPFQLTSPDSVCKLYLQVKGADNYWETVLTKDPTSGQPFFEILIPKFVQEGQFDFIFSLEDCNGNISPGYSTKTTVSPTADCNSTISGSVGITVRAFYLGEVSGTARFFYEMYTIPDRLDIRYNGEWVSSTGALFNQNVIIPDCSGTQDGFVSGTGELSFFYDPKKSRNVEVYVSGCFSGTEWYINSICPE